MLRLLVNRGGYGLQRGGRGKNYLLRARPIRGVPHLAPSGVHRPIIGRAPRIFGEIAVFDTAVKPGETGIIITAQANIFNL